MDKLSLKSTIVIISLLFIFAGCLTGSSSPFPAHSNTGQELNNAMHSGEPTLVDFYATWCPVCKAQAPITTALKQKYSPDKVNILEIDVDKYPGLLSRYSPKGYIPTLVIFDKNGNLFKINVGFTSKEELESQINEVLSR